MIIIHLRGFERSHWLLTLSPVEAKAKCDPFDNVNMIREVAEICNSHSVCVWLRLSNIDKAAAQTEFEDAAKR